MAASAAPQPGAAALALTLHHRLRLRRHLVLIAVFTVAAAAATRGGASASASTHATAAAAAPGAAPAAESSSSSSPPAAAASFVRARCAATLYPALCCDALLPYAAEVQDCPAILARIAADVAAARLRVLSARVKDILRHGGGADLEPADGGGAGGGPSETAALRDCASTVSAAASLARQSSAELSKLEPGGAAAAGSTTSSAAAGSRQARWEVSNAKTWLSAAMANEGTCADGLLEAGAAGGGKEVSAGVAAVRQYTSNALALVNGIPL